jgi:hypothetical protein
MDPVVSVQTLLLRAQMPELTLRPGAAVTARVASRGEAHGVLVLAGIPLTAQLPEGVEAGATLKLLVQEVTPERVVLRLDTPATPVGQAPAPPQPAPRVSVQEPPRRRPGANGDTGATVALAFDSPALGRLDLRIDLGSGTVQAAIATPPGRAFEAADTGAERLRAKLAETTGRNATVRVTTRREPFDLYA